MPPVFETYGSILGLALAGTAVVALLGLLVYSVVWAYRDAQARGKPGWAVALLVLLIDWPLSLLLWYVFRPALPSHPAVKPTAKPEVT